MSTLINNTADTATATKPSISSTLSFTDTERQSIREIIQRALAEDLSSPPRDISTLATVPSDIQSSAIFIAKDIGILSGLKVAELVFSLIDSTVTIEWFDGIYDGCYISKKGTQFGIVRGAAQSLLTGERTVLNVMQRMSGIATMTYSYAQEIKQVGSSSKILDTRKTAPGLRILDKLAVKHGGGVNHRIGLYDMFMIKDNHITASGSIENALANCYKWIQQQQQSTSQYDYSHVKIEIETRTLDEVKEVLRVAKKYPIHRIMLDNMVSVVYKDGNNRNYAPSNIQVDISRLQEAVQYINGQYETEASGNVNIGTIGRISEAQPTFISVGALTHSVPAYDISLKIAEKNGSLNTAHLNLYDAVKSS